MDAINISRSLKHMLIIINKFSTYFYEYKVNKMKKYKTSVKSEIPHLKLTVQVPSINTCANNQNTSPANTEPEPIEHFHHYHTTISNQTTSPQAHQK